MLYQPTLPLQYHSGRSANEAYRFLQENLKEPTPSRATCFNWYHKFDNGGESLGDSRRTGRPHMHNRQLVLANSGARPDFSVRELSDLRILLGLQYTMIFGLLAKSRSCLESYHML
ncbi:unnamed protein product [Heligmosomoides polygyrus]|uniref:HTH_48 domain-containing protein n=1 Tax=Heligmosomoides polygyrus TaxID=6339 RepID=A0A183FJU7_HELPZ|nr:unnamed protein product [Heligmosomoides polygyrus]